MRKPIQFLTCFVLLAPAIASAAPAHVHGVGALNITVEGSQLTLMIESPLDPFLGFERPPRTAKEKASYADMMKRLNDPASLFKPSEAALCKLKSVKVSEPFPNGKANPDGHADIDAEYVFQCEKPAELKGIEATVFKQFPELSTLNVKRVGPGGQGAGKLTPRKPGLAW